MLPRGDNKKENMRKHREAKEIELQEKVCEFVCKSVYAWMSTFACVKAAETAQFPDRNLQFLS